MGRAEDLFGRISEGGESAIDGLIRDRASEELSLDFKRSADNGTGSRLHDTDRGNLARAISGFGNSEGGVVVWGVDCRDLPDTGDVASAKIFLENPQRFKSWLEGAVSGCTVPPHPRVRHVAIQSTGGTRGFVVTHISKSPYAPHQCVRPLYYYIRAGSDFVPAPHGVLAGLFGRKAQPFVFHMWSVAPAVLETRAGLSSPAATLQLGLILASDGPGVARDLYLNVKMVPPRGPTQIRLLTPDRERWTGFFAFGLVLGLVSVDSYKLAPKGMATPVIFQCSFAPPFESDLYYELAFGHQESPVRIVERTVDRETLQSAYERLLSEHRTGGAGHEFVRVVMALEQNEIQGPEAYGEPV